MKKKFDIINVLKKKFKFLKNKKISKNNDLLKDHILDSLELMSFLLILEKNTNFNIKKYLNKNKSFKIENLIKSCL